METVNHLKEKSKKTSEDRKIFHDCGLAESIL
jgi:hypothetical protein